MATQPPTRPDTIEPQSPQEAPATPDPIEQPVPAEPVYNPDGGDIDEPGRGPNEVPPEPQQMGFEVSAAD